MNNRHDDWRSNQELPAIYAAIIDSAGKAAIRLMISRTLILLLLVALSACTQPKPEASRAKNFPVVEPFAIDRAGSKATVEFELPNALDNGVLRPVFIGFRGIARGGTYTKEELKESMKQTDYMDREAIPVRIRLWRIENGEPTLTVPKELDEIPGKENKFKYVDISGDGYVIHHDATGHDAEEMMAIGQFDLKKAYFVYQFARITPPIPGRYRLEIESLKTHPMLHGLDYQLIVTHYHAYGIR
jgi:hypothetical protein